MTTLTTETTAKFAHSKLLIHFERYFSNYMLSALVLSFGVSMVFNPKMLTTNPQHIHAYDYLLNIFPQEVWALGCLITGSFRLVCLMTNTKSSLYIVVLFSFLSCFLWINLMIGAWVTIGVTFGFQIFFILTLIDIFNTYISTLEIAETLNTK